MIPANYSSISFPFLGLEVNPPRAITLGPANLYLYGLVIALGLMLAVLYACKRSKEFGIQENDILDGVLWITPLAIVCARAYYVIFSWQSYAADPISVFYIWEGGLAIYGGVLGAILGLAILCKLKKIRLSTLLDITLLGFLIGQSLGRWGNFFNREAFGAATDSFFRMGLFNTKTGGWEFYHPTFLYESVWNACGFVLLHFLSKKRKYDGQIALGYALWYGLGRCFIEALRVDSLYWGPFRVSQLLAAVSCLTAALILVWQSFRSHSPEALYVNRAPAPAEMKTEEKTEAAPEATAEVEIEVETEAETEAAIETEPETEA